MLITVLLTVWFLALAAWLLVHSSEKLTAAACLVVTLALVFELWLAQLWAKDAAEWEQAYERDMATLRKRLSQSVPLSPTQWQL